jgi:hypothetical protein
MVSRNLIATLQSFRETVPVSSLPHSFYRHWRCESVQKRLSTDPRVIALTSRQGGTYLFFSNGQSFVP